ncbi:MAG: hypothetical protein HC857_17725 [Synechococcales cyanobacterium RU_4_20]|nr:hypothetical protein [Synechococcales cyanobacterium RU_4_20]NJR69080.1 hypothetical protein [Synechococcales cyanobacterium CRU_2_2]
MATQKVPLTSLKQIQQHIRTALAVPQMENSPCVEYQKVPVMAAPMTLGDLGNIFRVPAPASTCEADPNADGRWFVSSVNPGAALLQLKGLRVKPGLRLVPYLLRTPDGGGVGHICAVPEASSTTEFLESALSEDAEWHYPPFPEGSLSHTMLALEGDRSPMSYIVASILCREIQAFGAVGKDRQWGQHQLIETVPAQVNWRWKNTRPKSFASKVKTNPDGTAAVEFFSCRTTSPFAIFHHLDQYAKGTYVATSKDRRSPSSKTKGRRPRKSPAEKGSTWASPKRSLFS